MRAFERLFLVNRKNFWIDVSLPLAENQDPPIKINQSTFFTGITDITDNKTTNVPENNLTELLLPSEELEIVHDYISDTMIDSNLSEEMVFVSDHLDEVTSDQDYYVYILKRAANNLLQSLVLPSLGAINSLVSDVNIAPTNVFTVPLIPGPVSDFSALYTSLKCAEGVSSWACGDSSMTIISLDLDLFEMMYLIVRLSDVLRRKYILCLGELHVVFAHLRAIGSYICESGIDSAWINANWFDSECVVRQVLECKHMKRALEAHEATLVAICILFLEHSIKTFPDKFLKELGNIQTVIRNLRNGISEQSNTAITNAFYIFQNLIDDLNFNELMENLDKSCGESKQFQFMKIYQNMVERLFIFIEASRIRNWLLHLSAAEDRKDLCAMDRIKYRRMWVVYIADMKQLQYDYPEVWKQFSEGEFSVQKSMIPGTAIGRDHAEEQEVGKLKSRGGIKGITRNENSRIRHFLVAPILSVITEEMESMGNGQQLEKNRKLHHQLNLTYTAFQNKRVTSLLEFLENHNFELFPEENVLKNVMTGQVYPDMICKDILSVEKIGDELYNEFVKDRLQADSIVDVLAPLKKASLKTFKSCNKEKVVKLKDRVVVLRENCNLFGRCAILSQTRHVDTKEVIGDH